MHVYPLYIALFTAWAVLASAPAAAVPHDQDHADTPAAVQAWPSLDVTDLWHKWRPKSDPILPDGAQAEPTQRFLVLAPAIGVRPTTGLTLGVNGNMAFFRGDSASTHISSMAGGLRVSQKQQVLSNVRFSIFTADDRWFLQGDNRLNWTSLNTYELGSDAGTENATNVKYTFARLYETAYRSVRPGLFVGGGLNLNLRSNIRAGDSQALFAQSAYLAYDTEHGLPIDHQVSTGTSACCSTRATTRSTRRTAGSPARRTKRSSKSSAAMPPGRS